MQYLRYSVYISATAGISLAQEAQSYGSQTSLQRWSLPSCQTACSELRTTYSSKVYFPANDPSFVVWDAKQQEVYNYTSGCRVTPTSSEEVADILSTLKKNWCRFAVKSGGHVRNVDDSVSYGGVTIDLVDLKTVELAANRLSARVGSGNTLGSLYDTLESHDLEFVGGRVYDVGVGGFWLGGRLSNWAPKYGFAADNVFEYELVLPNTTIVTVSSTSHTDLFFALRGGMNNLGIVTHFTVRAFPSSKIFSGAVTLPTKHRKQVADEAYKLTTEWSNDTNLTYWYSYKYNATHDNFSLAFSEAYTAPIQDPAPFRSINSLPEANTSGLRVDWMSSFAKEVTEARPPGARNLYATLTYLPSACLDLQIQDIYAEEVSTLRNITNFSPNLIIQLLPYESIKKSHGSALELSSSGPLSIVLLTIGWHEAADDSEIYSLSHRWTTRAKAATVAAGKDHKWLYINYASQQQDPFAGYEEKNLRRLKEVAKSVDSLGIFSSRGLCSGYFKLQ